MSIHTVHHKSAQQKEAHGAKAPSYNRQRYVVKEGDSLGGIAARFKVSPEELARRNSIEDPDRIKVGDALLIPKNGSGTRKLESIRREHVVQEGEVLGLIAARNKISMKEILRLNPGLDPDKITVGMKICLSPGLAPSRGQSDRSSRNDSPHVSKAFLRAVDVYAQKLGIKSEWLLACIHFETKGSFSPQEENDAGSGAVGLIQFTKIAVAELNTGRKAGDKLTLEKVASMSSLQQLKLVYDYFKIQIRRHGSLKSFDDCYMAVLCPGAIGKGGDFVLYQAGSQYSQNSSLDRDQDGKITKREASLRAKRSLKLFT